LALKKNDGLWIVLGHGLDRMRAIYFCVLGYVLFF